MKKVLLVLVALLCVFSVWGGVDFVLNVKPYFTFDNAPAGIASDKGTIVWNNSTSSSTETYSGLVNSDWWETRQDYWLRAFEKPGFLDIGSKR